jgi:hypothetical protein
MGPAADIALATGLITMANEAIFAPIAGKGTPDINWRLIPATAVLALLLDGLSKINSQLALGVAVTALVTAIFGSFGKAGSPVANLSKALGYQ